MPQSRMQNKVLQSLYRPGKSKSGGGMFKLLTEMDKALESGVTSLKGKKKKDEADKKDE